MMSEQTPYKNKNKQRQRVNDNCYLRDHDCFLHSSSSLAPSYGHKNS